MKNTFFLIKTISLAQYVIHGLKANNVRKKIMSKILHFDNISQDQNLQKHGGTTSIGIPEPWSYLIFLVKLFPVYYERIIRGRHWILDTWDIKEPTKAVLKQ